MVGEREKDSEFLSELYSIESNNRRGHVETLESDGWSYNEDSWDYLVYGRSKLRQRRHRAALLR